MGYIILILLFIIALPVLILAIGSSIANAYYFRKQQKFEASHPLYVEFTDKYYEMCQKLCDANETYELKRKIDNITKEMNYYPKDSKQFTNLQTEIVETQRKLIECEELVDNILRERNDYVKSNLPAMLEEINGHEEAAEWEKLYNNILKEK